MNVPVALGVPSICFYFTRLMHFADSAKQNLKTNGPDKAKARPS